MIKLKANTCEKMFNYQLQTQATARKQPTGVPSVSSGATQFSDPRSLPQTQQKGTATSTNAPQIPPSKLQGQSNLSHPIVKVERQSDSHGMQVSQATFFIPRCRCYINVE